MGALQKRRQETMVAKVQNIYSLKIVFLYREKYSRNIARSFNLYRNIKMECH